MSENPRDTRFAGFAHLLSVEVANLLIERAGSNDGLDDAQEVELLITQRAYDLVRHTISHIQTANEGCTIDEHVEVTPDLTSWPEEGKQ